LVENPAALEVRDLSAGYGDREILRRINMRIEQGEIFGLFGPNGAGKTTLIRAICGRLKPRAGAIMISGQAIRHGVFRQIGLVPQEIALYPHLTILENLQVFGRLSGLGATATKDALSEVIKHTALAGRLQDRVEVLSGGWKRRVNIAAAILHRPALLILDEPMVGVDIDARNTLQNVILKLRDSGVGILLITHDLRQAETMCTQVGFLHKGVIEPQGAPRALLDLAFHGQHQIIIETQVPVSVNDEVVLRGRGFSPIEGGQCWSVISNSPLHQITEHLEQSGVATKEVRFRKPGLDSLFLRLADQPVTGFGGSRP
jgi:ABC-2 type transport system ATP-binding protein